MLSSMTWPSLPLSSIFTVPPASGLAGLVNSRAQRRLALVLVAVVTK